jgi:hypothetical protein
MILSKRAFILSQPLNLPAAEVVNRGKQKGLKFSTGYVWVTRSNAKANGKVPAAKGLPPRVQKSLEKLISNVIAKAQKEILTGIKRFL